MATEGQDQAAYTPGPWYVSNGSVYSDHVGDLVIRVAYMARDTERTRPVERDANARLIAAAPDLLATCYDFDAWINGPLAGVGLRMPDGGRAWNDSVRALRTAIAKAKGRAE